MDAVRNDVARKGGTPGWIVQADSGARGGLQCERQRILTVDGSDGSSHGQDRTVLSTSRSVISKAPAQTHLPIMGDKTVAQEIAFVIEKKIEMSAHLQQHSGTDGHVITVPI